MQKLDRARLCRIEKSINKTLADARMKTLMDSKRRQGHTSYDVTRKNVAALKARNSVEIT